MDKRIQGEIFEGLKSALRARGMTYADLAAAMKLSEPTIKRVFSEADCKMARLLQICDVLDVSLLDLLERAERARTEVFEVPVAVEAELAADRQLFYIFLLLRIDLAPEEVRQLFDLSEPDFFLYMRKLERLGFASAAADGTLRLSVFVPLKFRRGGPLNKFVREINTRFLIESFNAQDEKDSIFLNASRRMLPETAELLKAELEAFLEKMTKLARQDQLITPAKDLQSYKVSAAFGPIDYAELLLKMRHLNILEG